MKEDKHVEDREFPRIIFSLVGFISLILIVVIFPNLLEIMGYLLFVAAVVFFIVKAVQYFRRPY